MWNFENMAGWQFWKWVWGCVSKKFEKGSTCSNNFENKVHFQTEFEKYPTQSAPGSWALAPVHLGPGPRVGYFFKISLKMDPVFKIVWKIQPFSNFFEKHPQTHFQNCHPAMFSKFHLLIRDADYYLSGHSADTCEAYIHQQRYAFEYSNIPLEAWLRILDSPCNDSCVCWDEIYVSLFPWQSRMSRDLRPLLKGETLKKWLGDSFENGSGGVSQKKF